MNSLYSINLFIQWYQNRIIVLCYNWISIDKSYRLNMHKTHIKLRSTTTTLYLQRRTQSSSALSPFFQRIKKSINLWWSMEENIWFSVSLTLYCLNVLNNTEVCRWLVDARQNYQLILLKYHQTAHLVYLLLGVSTCLPNQTCYVLSLCYVLCLIKIYP